MHNESDDDYPYGVRPSKEIVKPPARTPWSRTAWHLCKRAVRLVAVTAALIAPFALLALSVIGLRARAQAQIVDELVRRKCIVYYYHERDDAVDRVPTFLRTLFGDDFWNDVDYVMSNSESPDDAKVVPELSRRLFKLSGFRIANPHFSFEQIAEWPGLQRLEDLGLFTPHLSDADLMRIASLPKLKILALESESITDAGVRHLSALSRLETLRLSAVQFNSANSPRDAPGFQHLEELEIFDSPSLSDESIVQFGRLPALQEVTIRDALLGDRAIVHLSEGGKLFSLEISPCNVTNAGLAALDACHQLDSLELGGASVTDQAIEVLLEKPLFNVALTKSQITDNGLLALSRIKSLKYLDLTDSHVTGESLDRFRGYEKRGDVEIYPFVESFSSLDLTGAPITTAGFQAIARANLTPDFYDDKPSLRLARTLMTDEHLMLFATNQQLGHLDVSETHITREGLHKFREARRVWLESQGLEDKLSIFTGHDDSFPQSDIDNSPVNFNEIANDGS